MTDEEMVAYLARCQLDPSMPRPSIETLLHAFVPHPHVDHTHPDAIGAIVGATDGERLARGVLRRRRGLDPVHPARVRALEARRRGRRRAPRGAGIVLLAKHGLVTWGATAAESLRGDARCDQPRRGVRRGARARQRGVRRSRASRRSTTTSRESRCSPRSCRPFAAPSRSTGPRILQVDASRRRCSSSSRGRPRAELSQVGAACPDHLVHTQAAARLGRVRSGHRRRGGAARPARRARSREFQEREHAYFEQLPRDGDDAARSEPSGGPDRGRRPRQRRADAQGRAAGARPLPPGDRRDARGLGGSAGFVSLDDEESFAIEYWPLELYKLSLAPPPGEFQGAVVLITGGAGGIGSAVAREFAARGACVVVTDLDVEGAAAVAAELGEVAICRRGRRHRRGRRSIAAYREAALAFGGVDIVVSNAGIASSAPITETSLELWDRNHDILARGYFLVAREAARLLRRAGNRRQHRLHRLEERARPGQGRGRVLGRQGGRAASRPLPRRGARAARASA